MILLVAFLGGLGVLILEGRAAEPEIKSIPEALWWALVTMTTVGYGDYTPHGAGSRLLAVLIMFTGLSLISLLTATIASAFVSRRLRESQGLQTLTTINHILLCGWHHKL
ncbi:MAG: potassium channel family protein, partial [Dehalococcoidia bacterium]